MNYSYTALNQLELEGGKSNAKSVTMIRDWRKQLRAPPTYRIGNRTIRIHYHIALLCICFGMLIFIFFIFKPQSQSSYSNKQKWYSQYEASTIKSISEYNYTYPLTAAIISNGIHTYRIGLIADMDTASKDPKQANLWRSYLKKGFLSYSPSRNSIVVTFSDDDEKTTEISGGYSLKGRGMELSELVTFNGRILTFDDRTGLVYQLIDDKPIPWIILMDGGGKTAKGFKSEWATVKDETLYIGSMGKEWTTSAGEFESFDPMYVKAVTMSGEVHHLNWVENYKAIRSAMGIEWPGYMIHESAVWSTIQRKWYFLPRRCSKERYNETIDEMMGCNALISADENFRSIETIQLGPYKPMQGFSSFKFVPGSLDNVIVALLTEEINGKTATYITSFTIKGEVIAKPIQIHTDLKYEGIDFF